MAEAALSFQTELDRGRVYVTTVSSTTCPALSSWQQLLLEPITHFPALPAKLRR